MSAVNKQVGSALLQITLLIFILSQGWNKYSDLVFYLKVQCGEFRGKLGAEMEYNILNSVFISVQSSETRIFFC